MRRVLDEQQLGFIATVTPDGKRRRGDLRRRRAEASNE
jgi:hypothetical protein